MNSFGCVRNTIRLRSGLYFDLANPDPSTITLADVAGALSKICRFGGQGDFFMSVAEHCCNCAVVAKNDGLPWDGVLAVLLHDASEAFTGDIVRPMKIMLRAEFPEIERRVTEAVEQAFGVDFAKWHDEIKEIDNAMVIAERDRLFSADDVLWEGADKIRRLNPTFYLDSPPEAEARFLNFYDACKKAMA